MSAGPRPLGRAGALAVVLLTTVMSGAGAVVPGFASPQEPEGTPPATATDALEIEVFHLIFRVAEPGLYEVAQVMSVVKSTQSSGPTTLRPQAA